MSTDPRLVIDASADAVAPSTLAEEVREGLTAERKRIDCRFLYDGRGSEIFEEIRDLPEYYPSRKEIEILERESDAIARSFDAAPELVELGSGSSRKTRILIDALLRVHGRLCYVPIDISEDMLREGSEELLEGRPGLSIHGMADEYFSALSRLRGRSDSPRLVAVLGSTIGNFDRQAAAEFLGSVQERISPDDRVLLGVDLRKDPEVLVSAYDDAAGVTARFSKNLLVRINRELDADFEVDGFQHVADYHREAGHISIHLEATSHQRVRIPGAELEVELAAGERIHVEDSFKYAPEEIDALAASADFEVSGRWFDAERMYSLNQLVPV